MKSLVVEGWRFSLTSYAVVNQYQCLEILKRPEIQLYHSDLPFFTSNWRQIPGLMDAAQEEQIRSLPTPPAGLVADASLRIAHPTLVQPTGARNSWCWVITEFGILENSRIADQRPAGEALGTPGVRFITSSRWSHDGLVRSGADPASIRIIPCGYDPALLRPLDPDTRAQLRRQLGWEGRFIFLNVSTLVWNKGVSALLNAFASIMDRYPEAALVLKGSTELLQSDRRLRESLAAMPGHVAQRLTSRIQYIGDNLNHAQMAAVYGAADAYVSPYHAEGFNLPVLEAGACGVPVVCTGGGSTDDFTDECFAMRVRSRVLSNAELEKNHGPGARALVVDGDHLVQLMTSLITDRSIGERARVAGPAWLSTRFTWKHAVDRLLDVLFT